MTRRSRRASTSCGGGWSTRRGGIEYLWGSAPTPTPTPGWSAASTPAGSTRSRRRGRPPTARPRSTSCSRCRSRPARKRAASATKTPAAPTSTRPRTPCGRLAGGAFTRATPRERPPGADRRGRDPGAAPAGDRAGAGQRADLQGDGAGRGVADRGAGSRQSRLAPGRLRHLVRGRAGGKVAALDGVAPEGEDEAWLLRLDRGAEAVAGEQPVGFGESIALRIGKRPAGGQDQAGPAARAVQPVKRAIPDRAANTGRRAGPAARDGSSAGLIGAVPASTPAAARSSIGTGVSAAPH